VVTARAMAITRVSCRRGSRNRVVSGATASQPTNDSMSSAAACPTAAHPCGANGAQFAARAIRADPLTATVTTTMSSATSSSWAVALLRSPPAARASTTSSSKPAMIAWAPASPGPRNAPMTAVTYPAPMMQTMGAPDMTPARKDQPAARPAQSPSPALT
jgi:hypothetical protein